MSQASPRYVEDFFAGQAFDLGVYEASEADMLDFSRRYDPLPFHVDHTAAAESIYGGLTSSGWFTALIMYRLMYRGFLNPETGLGSPGLELAWLKPMRAGDRLRGQVLVESVRVSKSKPEIGFVGNTATLTDQHDGLVYRVRNTAIFRSRPA